MGIRSLLQGREGIERINELLTMHMGPDFILANRSIDFRNDISAGELETLIAQLDQEIKHAFPRVKRVFTEAESRVTVS